MGYDAVKRVHLVFILGLLHYDAPFLPAEIASLRQGRGEGVKILFSRELAGEQQVCDFLEPVRIPAAHLIDYRFYIVVAVIKPAFHRHLSSIAVLLIAHDQSLAADAYDNAGAVKIAKPQLYILILYSCGDILS